MFKRYTILLLLGTLSWAGLSAQGKPDWPNLGRYAQENARLQQDDATVKGRVVFMGNSITEGWVREDAAFFTSSG